MKFLVVTHANTGCLVAIAVESIVMIYQEHKTPDPGFPDSQYQVQMPAEIFIRGDGLIPIKNTFEDIMARLRDMEEN